MKIAHAIQIPLLHQGGVEVLVRTLLESASAEDGLVLISRDSSTALESSGLASRLRAHLPITDEAGTQQWAVSLSRWLAAQQVDLCHFHMVGTYDWWAPEWCGCPIREVAKSGIRTVTTNHQAFTFFDQIGPPSSFLRKCVKTLSCWPGKASQLASVEWEATVSKHDLAISRRSFPGFARKFIQVYHSRLDVATPVNLGTSHKIILNVATVAFRKGQHILTEAFSKIAHDFPDWRLQIVGTLAQKECVGQMRETIRKAGLADRVDLIGAVADPTHYFQTCGIYVQPSLLEGLGLSLQEAMFYGRACVGSACGGIPELIEDSSAGVLFPSGNVNALAAELARLMADSELRDRLGQGARQSILNRGITKQSMCATYRNLYRTALGQAP